MALTLVEAAKLERDILKAGVIEIFASSSPIAEALPQMDITGNSFKYNIEATLPGVAWRMVNDAYTEGSGTYTQASESLFIVGGEIDVDRYITQTRGSVNDQRAIAASKKMKALSTEYTKVFFDGDTTATGTNFPTVGSQPNGLNVRLTGAQVLTAGGAGAALTLDMLDSLIDAVVGEPDMLVTFKAMRREITKLYRTTTHYQDVGMDAFGRQVLNYNGVPIRVLDEAEYANPILDFDETLASSGAGTGASDTGSIYALRFGADEFLTGLQNGGMMVDDLGMLETHPKYRTRVEWYCGWAIMHPRAAARLKGILQS